MAGADQDQLFTPEPEAPTAERRLQELNLFVPEHLDLNIDSVFPRVQGWGWKNEMKQKVKLLNAAQQELSQMLFEGEEVIYIAKGIRYSFVEFYFMGLWASMINHTVFVLTNLRLIMLHTNGKGIPKKTFWMIYYSQIDKFKASWNGMINLKLKDGKKLAFSGFQKTDRKKLPDAFETALEGYRAAGFAPETSQSMENLCTYCKEAIPKNIYDCDDCGAKFWTPGQIAWRSFVFPSWGDFVMGHTTIAVLEMFGGVIAWLMFVVLLVDGINTNSAEKVTTAFIMLAIANGIDAAVTAHISRKGLHPRKGPNPIEASATE
ncbi:MAG: hypothetical protein KDA78_08950 [Planctomycetaceae bacterium]|nr:hypothetical protein [Planctomycetaceae bacterium]